MRRWQSAACCSVAKNVLKGCIICDCNWKAFHHNKNNDDRTCAMYHCEFMVSEEKLDPWYSAAYNCGSMLEERAYSNNPCTEGSRKKTFRIVCFAVVVWFLIKWHVMLWWYDF